MSDTAGRWKGALLISMLACAPATRSWSQEDDPTRDLQNLVYYPHARQAVLTPDFSASLQGTGETYNAAGAQTRSRDTSFQSASLGFAYGLIDRLRIEVSEGYLFGRNTQTTTLSNGSETSVNSDGFSDPTFAAAYRFLESRSHGGYWDIAASVTPAIGDKQSALSGQTGNDLAGAWSATLSAPLYEVRGVNEFELAPSVTRNFGGNSQGTTAANSTQSTSYLTGALLLQDRIHITRAFFVQPGITLNLGYSYQTTSQVAGSPATSHDMDPYVTPALALGWLVTRNFLLEATFSYSSTDTTSAPPVGGATDAPNSQTAASLLARISFGPGS